MPTTPTSPSVLRALDEINPNYPDPEQHRLDPESHCINPKCDYRTTSADDRDIEQFGRFTCPQCGTENVVHEEPNPGGPPTPLAGIGLREMGQIGEDLIERMHEIPGIGVVTWVSHDVNFPIDCVVTANDGTKYGVEIKTNHSQAQPRFKLGDRKERQDKIQYCMENGLKQAICGVRLNFFNDLANVFWREGFTDTWFGNKSMKLVATVNFSDLNPFQSPNPATKERMIETSDIPDQSLSDDSDIDAAFGPATSSYQVPEEPPPPVAPGAKNRESALREAADEEQPRLENGRFTFKDHVHEVKVVDKKGNHKGTLKRCLHCGVLYEKPKEHQGRFACPTCGEDPERKLHLTKVIVASPQDLGLDFSAWNHDGLTSGGHRRYTWQDPTGYKHIVVLGSGRDDRTNRFDQNFARQRMTACMLGKCSHARNATPEMAVEANPGEGVFRPGDQVNLNGSRGIITEIDGGLCVVQDLATGQDDVLPLAQLERASAAKKPDFLFVYYMSGLKVEKYHHNTKHSDLLQELLGDSGYSDDPDPNDVTFGEVYEYSDGSLKIEHTTLGRPEVRQAAEEALRDWIRDKDEVLPASLDDEDDRNDQVEDKKDTSAKPDPESNSSIGSGEYDHWRRLPRDDDGQWQAL